MPSGSLEPTAVAVTSRGSFPVAGDTLRAAVGDWLGAVTVIVVAALPERAFVAVKVTVCVPTSPAVGVQLRMPLALSAAGVNVAPAGIPVAVNDPIPSPSGSLAVTVTVSSVFSDTVAVGGAATAGGRSPAVTVITVLAEPLERAFAAVKVTVCVPTSLAVGVQVRTPLALSPAGVNEAPAGSPVAVSDPITSPSGSLAVTVTVSKEFSATSVADGLSTVGARSMSVTVMVVDAEPFETLLAVNVTV